MSTELPAGPASLHLLPLLRHIDHVSAMRLEDWDRLLPLARQARLLGTIAHRIADRPDLAEHIPARVRGHMAASINYAAHRLQMVRMELAQLAEALPEALSVTLLKGAAYCVQGLPMARGRMPNDVDILVARRDLDGAETALKAGGWEMEITDAYDEHYYRQWSHELPPMRVPGHALEVDLHHTISPVTSRVRANDEALFAVLESVPGSRYKVLNADDQIIHASIHLIQDSEISGRLRDLVDIDSLVRARVRSSSDGQRLWARAQVHGASRPVWYALHFCHHWLGTPLPEGCLAAAPPALARLLLELLFRHACPPVVFERGGSAPRRLAELAGQFRYHWLRMPPRLLVRHLAHKSARVLRGAKVLSA